MSTNQDESKEGCTVLDGMMAVSRVRKGNVTTHPALARLVNHRYVGINDFDGNAKAFKNVARLCAWDDACV